ncbi:DmsC/YnfH family molybdoenzyme membrane anchor subunit [Bacillus sp. EB600]|uniref:dimethyl sulfoxide reductase anchor subunit family protein n=1 Tax=Bacillus sp. EB600 TaxID=2806345 RepID=UPI00210BC50B|nr:DmsC/YnfH family molybdoenzyme membrane anchor subunit [Bacillus sp. EB600]MCQ6278562.1 dimethyl sulfoxide reductase anchor subunit [Bacillus sp. EB600]
MHEWALLILTICVPAAIGGFLFLALLHKKIASSGQDPFNVMKLPLLVLAGFSIIGLFGAFFHLGKPTHAFYTILGFGRSWMSNEIVFTGAFIGLAFITAGLAILQKKTNRLLMLVTGLVGLMDVFCMASIYTATRINGWENINTYLVLYGVVFTLGPVLAASLMSTTLHPEMFKNIVKRAFAITIFGIGIQVIGTAILAVSTPAMQLISGTTAVASLSAYGEMIAIRWALEVAGLALLGFLAMASLKKVNDFLVYAAFAIFLIAEVMSRYLFYVMGA